MFKLDGGDWFSWSRVDNYIFYWSFDGGWFWSFSGDWLLDSIGVPLMTLFIGMGKTIESWFYLSCFSLKGNIVSWKVTSQLVNYDICFLRLYMRLHCWVKWYRIKIFLIARGANLCFLGYKFWAKHKHLKTHKWS